MVDPQLINWFETLPGDERESLLAEVRRIAWQQGQLDTVLKSLSQEAKLIGADAAQQLAVSWRDSLPSGYNGDEVLRQFTALMRQAQQETLGDG